jgi:hypothetical protein
LGIPEFPKVGHWPIKGSILLRFGGDRIGSSPRTIFRTSISRGPQR